MFLALPPTKLLTPSSPPEQWFMRNWNDDFCEHRKKWSTLRCSNNFEVGQWVHVKLRPCIINCQTNFFGPFEITEPIGKVAYRLCLPENSKIHLVLHSSLLWPHYGPLLTNSNALPPHAINNNPILEPLAILSQKMDTSTSPPTKMVII